MCPSDKFQDIGVSGTNFGKAAAYYRDILYMTSYARFSEADILFASETGCSRLIVRYHFCRPITSKPRQGKRGFGRTVAVNEERT